MDWKNWISIAKNWIPIARLRVLFKHLLVDCAALLVFWVTTTLAARLFPKNDYVIVKLEMFGLVILLGVLLIMLIKEMTKGGSNGSLILIVAT